MNRYEKALVVVLRISGASTSPAVLAIFLPTSWMAVTHQWLGLGAFPQSPLTDYLTRSIAALYAFVAGITWLVSFDVRRYAPLIWYLAAGGLAFGGLMLGIDLHAPMPWSWTVSEGPFIIVLSAIVLWLQWKAVTGPRQGDARGLPV